MNVYNIVIALMVQCRRFGANILMSVFAIMNVFNPQHRVCYDDYSMNMFNIATALVVQRRRFGANISMDVFAIENVATMQRRRFYAGIPMNVSSIMNALMVQRRRCCSFDSPGVARNEPTPGKRSQGDSTPSVLSFFCEGTLTMKHFMTDYTKNPQHLWRCSPQIICYPRVACTIVWQPWAIENATPMALTRLFHNTIDVNTHMNKLWIALKRYNTYSVVPHATYTTPG
ncbi:hypothetical protein [Segatella salivae]|uniref:hypothetical protein n=1 Tax=Segatella salivae TaxID=228604 RepID=UPI002151EAE5|nr:hypothetical protein [Segatella salivae]